MTLAVRVIPCLDVDGGRVVKGVNFKDLRDAGDPVELAKAYDREGADELTFLDISASHEARATTLEMVSACAEQVFIPLTVGGGISSMEDIELVFKAGASRVSMNSAAVQNPDLVRQAARTYGSQKITVAIDGKRNPQMPSGFELVVSGGTRPVGKDAVQWAGQCQDLGAGVILPTSMDGDGTRAGYDLEFTRAISDAVSLPVIASGGAGELEHFYEGVVRGGAQILLAASVFHYRTLSIRQVKEYLKSRGLPVL